MIGLDEEAVALEVRSPMSDGLDKADELSLIGSEGAVSGRDRSAKEDDRVSLLDQHRPKPVGGGVALDDEHLGEVRHGEHRGGGDQGLECSESRGRLRSLGEAILLKERGEWRGDGAVVVDELAIVPSQTEEAAHRPR
jgi:hypothetical protein